MEAEQARRASKTPWISVATREEMVSRYRRMLENLTDEEIKGFLAWVLIDFRYLGGEGNFTLFTRRYLGSEVHELSNLMSLPA